MNNVAFLNMKMHFFPSLYNNKRVIVSSSILGGSSSFTFFKLN
jgi:hypothetical protein